MKKFTILLFLSGLFIFSGTNAFSQRFLGAVSAGMNLSQVDGDEVYGFKKVGLNLGPSVIIPFGKNQKWSFTLEILLSQQGSYQKGETIDTVPDTTGIASYTGYKLKLTYVQVPFLFHFTDKKVIAVGAGFAYGQLVDVKEWEDGIRTTTNLRSPYNLSDFQVVADLKIRLWKKLWGDVRYSYSLVPIRSREFIDYKGDVWMRKQYNNVITLRLTYVFNDPYIKIRTEKGKKQSR